jgi:hypothetical protein
MNKLQKHACSVIYGNNLYWSLFTSQSESVPCYSCSISLVTKSKIAIILAKSTGYETKEIK